MNKNTSLMIRGMAILLIVGFHFQFDIFSFLFLVRGGEGIGSYLSRSALFIGENPINIFFILSSFSFSAVSVFLSFPDTG
ncbi:MAG: hypothetical protein Q8N98_00210 [bacterium]|nr:hypothetical protein [bacterium]